MIGYWYTFEPYFLLGKKNSFSAVPLTLTRFTEFINQQFQKTKNKSTDLDCSYKNGKSSQKKKKKKGTGDGQYQSHPAQRTFA